jgi:hypothetical protein
VGQAVSRRASRSFMLLRNAVQYNTLLGKYRNISFCVFKRPVCGTIVNKDDFHGPESLFQQTVEAGINVLFSIEAANNDGNEVLFHA